MEIKPFQEGDEAAILDLFQKSFGKPIEKEFWEWRYKQNPFLEDILAHLMWDGSKLVGHYAVCPIEMQIEDKSILTALSMTTMTHPEYGRKGIFKNLAESLYQELVSKYNIEMVWGFPNLNSHSGFVKNLAWNDLSTIPTLTLNQKDFQTFPSTGFRLYDKFDSAKSNGILLNQSGGLSVHKSTKYLNWRYTSNPSNTYQLISSDGDLDSYLVIKVFESFTSPGYQEIDILEHGYVNDIEVFKSLIGSILSYSRELKLNLKCINTWINLSDRRHLLFEKNRFSFNLPVTILGQRRLNQNLPEKVLDFKNWSISMGDSDIY